MAMIEGFRVRNYRALRDITLAPPVIDIVVASQPLFGAIEGDRWTMNPYNINDSGH